MVLNEFQICRRAKTKLAALSDKKTPRDSRKESNAKL